MKNQPPPQLKDCAPRATISEDMQCLGATLMAMHAEVHNVALALGVPLADSPNEGCPGAPGLAGELRAALDLADRVGHDVLRIRDALSCQGRPVCRTAEEPVNLCPGKPVSQADELMAPRRSRR